MALSVGAVQHHASVPGCTAAAERAVRLGVTIRVLPAPCRGLPPLELERAAITAINGFAGPWAKARHRHLAAIAGARLGYLIRGDLQAPGHRHRHRHRHRALALSIPAPASPIPAGLAALVAWVLTVASGGYLLAGWIAHGGLRRSSGRRRRMPPPVILSHFGLATAGLIGWIGYVISGSAAAAWLAVFLLLPVAGLGMATLIMAIPDSASPRRPHVPVVAISTHGILATVTLLLVLLAAIEAH